MKDTDVERRLDNIDPWLDQIDQRFNEMRELIIAESERTRRHIDVFAERVELHVLATEARVTNIEKAQKIVLIEVRGLATKLDRLTRGRNRPTSL